VCVPGEKLDYKACESLEEVLKRVQFKLVDLEQTNLDEDVRETLTHSTFIQFLFVFLCVASDLVRPDVVGVHYGGSQLHITHMPLYVNSIRHTDAHTHTLKTGLGSRLEGRPSHRLHPVPHGSGYTQTALRVVNLTTSTFKYFLKQQPLTL
jgi:hypothetical protein